MRMFVLISDTFSDHGLEHIFVSDYPYSENVYLNIHAWIMHFFSFQVKGKIVYWQSSMQIRSARI